jgi:hypothetical protein
MTGRVSFAGVLRTAYRRTRPTRDVNEPPIRDEERENSDDARRASGKSDDLDDRVVDGQQDAQGGG